MYENLQKASANGTLKGELTIDNVTVSFDLYSAFHDIASSHIKYLRKGRDKPSIWIMDLILVGLNNSVIVSHFTGGYALYKHDEAWDEDRPGLDL